MSLERQFHMESSSVDRGQDLSEQELVMRRVGRRRSSVPGREPPKPSCDFLRWKRWSLLCWRECPRGRCVGWQPGRVGFSENGLTYQRRQWVARHPANGQKFVAMDLK